MKKFLAGICAAALLMTGCGGGGQTADKPTDIQSEDNLQLGLLTTLNTDENTLGNFLDKFAESTGVKGKKHLPKFYDNRSGMQIGLESGEVEAISVYNSVAKYVVANDDKLEIVPNDALNKITYSFCFAVNKDDTALRADLDKVIDEMKADGSLNNLVDGYITKVGKGQTLQAVDIPKFDEAETIKVGVTGDLPPLDLILPDGSPAGFNTALLAEVAKRLNRNVELIQIESGARAAALQSKVIDVVFWVVVPFGNKVIPSDIDKPEGLDISTPYFSDNVAQIQLKK